jgi:hypothetical protein
MNVVNYLFMIFVFIGLGMLYDRVRDYVEDDDKIIRQYLLGNGVFDKVKPLIWIHLDYPINSRDWLTFYQRNTRALNKPYVYLCIANIIHLATNYNVCVIDDTSFKKLLDWDVDLDMIADPMKKRIRMEAMAKLLYEYGGNIVPSSFLPLRQLNLSGNYVGFKRDRSGFSNTMMYMPSVEFMGCSRRCQVMYELCRYLEGLNSDLSGRTDFENDVGKWLYQRVLEGRLDRLGEECLGFKDINGKDVLVDDLLRMGTIEYGDEVMGLWIPDDEIMNRVAYDWFMKMSVSDILKGNIAISRLFVRSQSV